MKLIDFTTGKEYAKLPIQNHFRLRLKNLKPKLVSFFEWCESLTSLSKSKLGKALSYAFETKRSYDEHFKRRAVVLSNNLAERGVKTLVIGGKSYLFRHLLKGRVQIRLYSVLLK